MGGALQLLARDERGPTSVQHSVCPRNNMLAFFKVGADSFHQVTIYSYSFYYISLTNRTDTLFYIGLKNITGKRTNVDMYSQRGPLGLVLNQLLKLISTLMVIRVAGGGGAVAGAAAAVHQRLVPRAGARRRRGGARGARARAGARAHQAALRHRT